MSGRKSKNLEATLNGIWWILCNGAIWNQLPARYGKSNSVWRFYRRWCEAGIWKWMLDKIVETRNTDNSAIIIDGSHVKVHQDATRLNLSAKEQVFGKTKGGRNSKISAAVNVDGKAINLLLVQGNEHDSVSSIELLSGCLKGLYVLADKAYDADYIRQYIESSGGIAVIPPKKNRKERIDYDKTVAKIRHRVENFFARIKRFRRVNTRYDKLSKTYMGFVTISSIADWIRS